MTQEGADRYAHQIGYRHSCAHHSHRLGSLSLLCHLHCHDGSRSEVGTMRQTLNESGAEQQPISRGYGCDDGSDGDDGSQEYQYFLGTILVHEYQREGSGAYAQCIDGDEVACLWNGYVHVVGNIGNDALDDKLCHAQGECTQSECKKSFFHLFCNLYIILKESFSLNFMSL